MTPIMHAVGALSLAVWALPVVAAVWIAVRRARQAPFRGGLPILVLPGLILIVQGIGTVVGPDEMMAILYLLAGAGR